MRYPQSSLRVGNLGNNTQGARLVDLFTSATHGNGQTYKGSAEHQPSNRNRGSMSLLGPKRDKRNRNKHCAYNDCDNHQKNDLAHNEFPFDGLLIAK